MKSIFNENFVEKEIVSLVNSTWNLLPNLKCASPPKKKEKEKKKSQTQTRIAKMQSKRALNVVHQNQVK